MKKSRFLAVIVLLLTTLISCTNELDIKVLQLNIWQEGEVVKGGYNAIVDEIERVNADFVMLSEVRNYKDTRFCDRIVSSLRERGIVYHSFYSEDSGILSKYPIIDSVNISPLNCDHGTIYKLIADMGDKKAAVYTAHLDYLSCAYYDAKGYDGNTWEKLETPLTDVNKVLAKNVASMRDDAIKLFIADANKEKEAGSLIFLGGDFNEPSHLDWGEETKSIRDHYNMVIPWTVSTMLNSNGYIDSYRERYPDVIKYPGFTYPANCKDIELSKLTWAPDADERERIDFIYYAPTKGLMLEDVVIHGPSGSICRNKRVEDDSADRFVEPIAIWPTDHKGVIATFKYKY